MIDKNKFDELAKMYLSFCTTYKEDSGTTYWEEEEFKWRGVKIFQDNWNVEAPDFAGMMKRSLSGVSNLMVSQAYFPEAMIEGFAEREPEPFVQCSKTSSMKARTSLSDSVPSSRNPMTCLRE